ncbi:MAG: hypothetical protein KKE24_05290 [Candidatus Thermoplasmatota archaeon]|nr:hypothetical protein [Candidatus Thermoplasmatota archaeon]
MKTAFILIKSPSEQDPTHMMERLGSKEDSSVILFEDAVYHSVTPAHSVRLDSVATEVLIAKDDLEARGFTTADIKVGKAVGYDEIVDCIMERTERTVNV